MTPNSLRRVEKLSVFYSVLFLDSAGFFTIHYSLFTKSFLLRSLKNCIIFAANFCSGFSFYLGQNKKIAIAKILMYIILTK
jgi:hypothetical protein